MNRPAATMLARATRGITLLEVLIACGLLIIGLSTMAAILPLAGFRLAQASLEDRASVLASNALAEVMNRGLAARDVFPQTQALTTTFGAVLRHLPTFGRTPHGPDASTYFASASTAASIRSGSPRTFFLEDDLRFTRSETTGKPMNTFASMADGTMGPRAFRQRECWGATLTRSDRGDLLFSEYLEGTGGNRYLEIYNSGTADADLSDYAVQLFADGSTRPTQVQPLAALAGSDLPASLAPGGTIVLANSAASLVPASGPPRVFVTQAVNFDGNDAIAILKLSTNAYTDIFGVIGSDPGLAWTGDCLTTLDVTLRRKSTISRGIESNPTTFNAEQWRQFPVDTWDGLGRHAATAGEAILSIAVFKKDATLAAGVTDGGQPVVLKRLAGFYEAESSASASLLRACSWVLALPPSPSRPASWFQIMSSWTSGPQNAPTVRLIMKDQTDFARLTGTVNEGSHASIFALEGVVRLDQYPVVLD